MSRSSTIAAVSTFHGGCHCGLVRFEVDRDLERVVACNCSICTRKGYLHAIVPRERFRLLAGADILATYRFGTMTAQHRFCRQCEIGRASCRERVYVLV